MATFYLINNVVVGTSQRYAGELVNDALESTTGITSAGGILMASSLTGLATAAGIAQSMKARGADPVVLEGIMQSAVAQYGVNFGLAHDSVDSGSMVFTGHVRYSAPIAAELISIVADVAVAGGAQIIAAQPDYPRKLQVNIIDANASISAGVLTIVGVGPGGEAVTEAVALTGGSAAKTTTNAFATVTSATVTALAGAAAADHISVGVATALGLPIPSTATSVGVYKADVDAVNEAVGTVDATARTLVPTTVPNAARNYDVWYRFTMSHVHTLS